MNKSLLVLASSMVLAASAQADSKFYGKMNVSLSYQDEAETFKLNSNASRVGVKGFEELGSTKVIYKAEYEVAIDDGYTTDKNGDGDTNTIKPRDAYIGLTYSGMGTIKMGNMDTPLKKSQGKFDLFNDVVDIKNVLIGENRMANSINYTTEKMGALQSSVAVILSEDDSSEGISANVTYNEGALYVAAAFDNKVKNEATQRLTAIYTMGDLKIGGLINNVDSADSAEVAANAEELGYAVNASMKMGMNTLKAQYEAGDQKTVGATSATVGVDHKLGKATKAFVYLNQMTADVGEDVISLALGLEHKF
ncbi:MAG: porin [Bermanella sp.]